MITPEELEFLRKRYGAAHLICHLCGKTMKEVYDNDGGTVLRCFNSTEKKYSYGWWEHVSQSTTSVGKQRDELVMRLIEAYETTLEGYEELKEALDGVY